LADRLSESLTQPHFAGPSDYNFFLNDEDFLRLLLNRFDPALCPKGRGTIGANYDPVFAADAN
jgi:hypothetical protein